MPFSGFLRPKPDGGKKPMIGKQIITPSAANQAISFGFHDGTGYSAGVVVPVAKVLATETIAGQAGTMPNRLAENLGTLGATLLNLITNGNFASGTTGWTFGSGTSTGVAVASNVLTFTPTAQYGGVYQLINYPDGHIIYASATIKAPLANGQNMQMWGGAPIVSTTLDNVFQQISMRFSNIITTKNLTISNSNTSGLGAVSVKNIVAIDLTAAFGAGLEPTQAQMDAIMTALGGFFDGNAILSKIASGGYINNGVLGTPEVLLNDPNHIGANILNTKSIYGVAGTFSNIKSIQIGTTTVNATTVNVAISAVDLTKSIVILTIKPVAGNTPGQSLAKGDLTTSTNLALTISDVTYPPEVNWTVVEFNNVKSKQTGAKMTSLATDTVAVSSVDISKSMLFFSCSSTDYTSTNGASFAMSLVLTNSTTITTKQPSSLNKTIGWQLIEFN